MFKLDFQISDMLLVLGILAISVGVFLIYKPAALIFLGAAFIFMAFSMYKPPEVKK